MSNLSWGVHCHLPLRCAAGGKFGSSICKRVGGYWFFRRKNCRRASSGLLIAGEPFYFKRKSMKRSKKAKRNECFASWQVRKAYVIRRPLSGTCGGAYWACVIPSPAAASFSFSFSLGSCAFHYQHARVSIQATRAFQHCWPGRIAGQDGLATTDNRKPRSGPHSSFMSKRSK